MTSPLPVELAKYLDVTVKAADDEFAFTPLGSRIRRNFSALLGQNPHMLEVDEELFEWIDLLESVEASDSAFTMVELGAGFGRWLVAGAVAARRVRDLRVRLVGVEAEHAHFQMMRQHFLDNDLDPDAHILVEAAVSGIDGPVHFVQGHSREWWGQAILPSADYGFGNWPEARVSPIQGLSLTGIIRDLDVIDLLDMDVQGAEADVIRGSSQTLINKVKRVHIGTHNAKVEAELLSLFNEMGWICRNRYNCHSIAATPFGDISFGDGVQTWINPDLN
jgi:FkbM family methyltransferase